MRTIIIAAIGLGLFLTTLPARTIHAQDDGGIARLSSAAYAPDSPVRENKLFRYQTGHYGFAYNCDGEECKRNNPAICWRKADQCQLPERIGFLERIRREAAQVSRRIADGSCNSGCEGCQQQNRKPVTQPCGCGNCVANHHSSDFNTEITSVANPPASQNSSSQKRQARQRFIQKSHLVLSAKNSKVKQYPVTSVEVKPPAASRRRSGLVSLTPLEPAVGVKLNPGEVLIGAVEVLPCCS